MHSARSQSRGPARHSGGPARASHAGGPTRGSQSGRPRRSRPFSSSEPRSGTSARRPQSSNRSFGDSSRFSQPRRNSGRPQGGGRGRFSSPAGSRGSRPSFGSRPQRKRGPKTPTYQASQFINKVSGPQTPEEIAPTTHQFRDFNIDRALLMAIETRGYVTPSPIQDQTIPHILEGRDVIGLANTGTGKTGAFLIPLLQKILTNPRGQALIMAPTRELALQIQEELKSFVRALPTKSKIYSVVCVGGVGIGPQIRALRQHNHFVIGTPGRLMDLMERRVLNVNTINSVVLDEADRMLDMGFIGDMRKILSQMPTPRHTLFFSATLSPEIKRLVSDFLTNPETVSVRKRDTAAGIDQDVIRLNGRDKAEVLIDLLKQPNMNKVIVFGETKHGVEKLSRKLAQSGIKAESIHGNKNHNQRVRSLKNFTDGRVRVLTATDVAARGLDINDVSHVINFDLPQSYDDYIHRIGRTGRSGKMGHALTFVA